MAPVYRRARIADGGRPNRTRVLAAAAALCIAVPGAVFVIDAISGDAPAPVQVAKKGSFDITE
jgi:hypothetical protein